MSSTLVRNQVLLSRNSDLDGARFNPPFTGRSSAYELDLHSDGDAPLCGLCQNFDIQSFTKGSTPNRGYLLRHVEAAAVGCEFCSLLLDSVKDVEKPTYFYKGLFHHNLYALKPDLYVHMMLSENYSVSKKSSNWLPLAANRLSAEVGDRFSDVRNASEHELCLAADPTSPAAVNGDIAGRCLSCNPASDEHWATIEKWVAACSNHPKCNQTVSGSVSINARESPLPARCIEIVKGDERIYLRDTEGEHGAYITLTHRWNQETEQCKTTASNINDRLEGRGFGTLPRLFQDVCIIAMKLDVRYVWIDSICIIQSGDNSVDWRREATKMAQYYQFSLLTIAGTMTSIGNGLLCPYPEDVTPWATRLVRLPYRDKLGEQAGYFYVYRRKVPLLDDYWTLVRNSNLFRRGWILQEWLLSKRIVWYTPNGLFFECHSNTPMTDGQESVNPELAKPDLQAHLRLKASFHFTNASILDFWYHALEVYSACHLTKPQQDQILAVAGLANEVGQILAKSKQQAIMDLEVQNDVYLSGLWLCDIHHGLLWEEDHSTKPWTVRVDNAPSWSWASLKTPVKWPEKEKGMQEACTITGVCLGRRDDNHQTPQYDVVGKHVLRPSSTATPGHDAAGLQEPIIDLANISSCLHIRGKLCTVHVRGYLETTENLYAAAFSTAYAPMPTDCPWRAICSPTRPELISGWGSLEQLRSGEPGCADFGIAVYAIHVSTRHVRSGLVFKRAEPVLDILFLERVDPNNHLYKRVGVGRITDEHLIAEFREAPSENIQLI